MILQSLAGLPAFLVYFCTAIIAVVAYLFVYTRVTPHDEFQLIRDNDPAAAIALGLSLLGFVLPVVSAIAHAANVMDCLIWSAIALIVRGRRAQRRLDDLLIMAARPNKEFGRRKPVAIPTAHPVKRSRHVALLLMGTLAVGGGAYALMPGENCGPNRPGMAADLQTSAGCPPRGSSSGGGGRGSSSLHFFSGDSSSNRSPSTVSSDSGSGGVTRGGFGSFARAFTSHFSVGG
jgi:hypothetical protein